MAKKVADFLKALATKAGVKIDENEALKTALASLPPELEVADEVVTAIDNGLLSISAAKNNHPEISKYYKALALNAIDTELERFWEGEKLPDDVIGQLKADGLSTAQRAILLAKQLKELEGKKIGASKVDKDQHQQQLAALNDELRKIKEERQADLAKHAEEKHSIRKDFYLGTLLNSYKTRFDDLDSATKQTVLNNIINKNLAAKKAKLQVDDAGNLTLVGEDGTNVFGDDHRPLTPKAFLDKVMADEKIVVVNEAGNNNNGSNGQQSFGPNGQQNGHHRQHFQNNTQNPGNGNNGKKPNIALQQLLNESQKDLELNANGVL